MTILQAMRDPNLFALWFQDDTWRAWFVFLAALFGLQMDEEQVATYKTHTGRTTLPQTAFKEGWLVVGRRGGKSLISALTAVFVACFREHSEHLKPGEVGTVMVLAADRKQARVIMRYIKGFLDGVPMLLNLVVNATKESIELNNRVVIEVHTASFRSTRGYTLLAVICDEIAFWRSEDSANPDTEVINAVRPGMATIPDSLLLCISSPYARRGALWSAYRRYHGKDNPRVLVWKAATRDMNPSVDQSVIDDALAEDEPAANAEYMAEFRRDIESFIAREAIEAVVVEGRHELPPILNVAYRGFVDPSGGSSDSMTLAIAHKEGDRVILDLVRERKPPFSPESVVTEFAQDLKRYRCSRVTGDCYAGEWPRERFRTHGITYEVGKKNRSELYLELLPAINSGRIELLDHPKLIGQLQNLERRTSRSGRDSIDHPPQGHDDVANAVAGVAAVTLKPVVKWEFA